MTTYVHQKHIVGLLIALLLLLPLAVFGQVTFNSGNTIKVTVSGTELELTPSGNDFTSVTVNAGTVVVALGGGSFSVVSTDRRDMTAVGDYTEAPEFTCTGSQSQMAIQGGGTITITPLATTCTVPTGGGGGGGGGGSSAPAPAPEPEPEPTPEPEPAPLAQAPSETPAPTVAQPSPVAQLVSPVFNADLSIGRQGVDVKRLQELLNSDSDTRIAESGPGSPGNETDFYGSLTAAAVRKFQVKHGVIPNADAPGNGRTGPATRAKLAEVFGEGVPATEVAQPSPVAVAASPVFNSDLNLGAQNSDVKRLQELLASDPSIYPEGLTTGYYGSLTQRAVRAFQLKYGVILSADSPGNGRVGPATRAKLTEVFGGAAAPAPAPQAAEPAQENAAEREALQQQILDLTEQVNQMLQQLQNAPGSY